MTPDQLSKLADTTLRYDDPDFAEKLAAAIGAAPGDEIVFSTPQFEREDGVVPVADPDDLFATLRSRTRDELISLGLRKWSEDGLWLFPYQWYDKIPEGMELVCIDGDTEQFERGVTDDDYRYGVLAYGIIPDFELAGRAPQQVRS